MKKLLLGTLILSSVVMATGVNVASEKSADMSVRAEVIQPLVVNVIKNIDLGKVFAGSKGMTDTGQFEISGEKNSVITTKIKEIQTTIVGGKRKGEMKLTNTTDPSKILMVSLEASGLGDNLQLGEHGKMDSFVKATTDVPVNQASGIYNGVLTLEVKYN